MKIIFADSTNRIYNQEDLNKLQTFLLTQGVFNSQKLSQKGWEDNGDLKITPVQGELQVSAKAGACVFSTVNGRLIGFSNASKVASVSSNVLLAVRADAVVLRLDQNLISSDGLNADGDNAVSLVVVAGSRDTALTDGEIATALAGDPFIRLANIYVPMGATEINSSQIEDTRSKPEMSRAVDMVSDSFVFYALTEDPKNLRKGQMWYNSTEQILKIFDGKNTIAIQNPTFDWGYYPPNGVDRYTEKFSAITENDSDESLIGLSANNLHQWSPKTRMFRQLFKMPNVVNPLVRFKTGNPKDKVIRPSFIDFFSVDGNGRPSVLIESFTIQDVPINEWITLGLNGTQYTQGTQYTVVFRTTYDTSQEFRQFTIQSSLVDDNEFLLGTQSAASASRVEDPLSMDWATPAFTDDRNLLMKISEKVDLPLGQTDTSGKNFQITQAFTSKSKDIEGIEVIKGDDIGTPTGNINIRLYQADPSGVPIGNVLAQEEFSDFGDYNSGDKVILPVRYNELVVGTTYVVVIDCDIQSDTDNYTIYFGTTSVNTTFRYTTADGYTPLFGELYFGIKVSSVKKIVVTNDNGKIDKNILAPLVLTVETDSDELEYSSDFDIINITEASANIPDLSAKFTLNNPAPFQKLTFLFLTTSGRTITWGTKFSSGTKTLPASTTSNKRLRVELEYDSEDETFRCYNTIVQA